MQLREHPAIVAKRDFFAADPRKIKVDPAYNVRDMDSADAKEAQEELLQSILVNGVKIPLVVRLDGSDLFLVQGHRRLRAVMDIIEFHKADIQSVPVIAEAKTVNDADRMLDLVISNSGRPLTALETAEVVKRLLGFGWDRSQIASRFGKSNAYVAQLEALLGTPEEVKNMVKDGSVSASTAVSTVRKEGGAKATATLKAAKAHVTTKGKGKGKVTKAAVARSKGQKAPLRPAQVEVLLTGLRKLASRCGSVAEEARKLLHSIGMSVED